MLPKYSSPEIERRWLVREGCLPETGDARRRRIEDKYIDGGRLRLRVVREAAIEPIFKLGKKYSRVGIEPEQVVSIYLSRQEYELLQSLPGAVARKCRYSIEGGSLDIHEHPSLHPTIFEVEFTTQAEAAAYVPPYFVGEEVTFNAEYTGYAFAQEAL